MTPKQPKPQEQSLEERFRECFGYDYDNFIEADYIYFIETELENQKAEILESIKGKCWCDDDPLSP